MPGGRSFMRHAVCPNMTYGTQVPLHQRPSKGGFLFLSSRTLFLRSGGQVLFGLDCRTLVTIYAREWPL